MSSWGDKSPMRIFYFIFSLFINSALYAEEVSVNEKQTHAVKSFLSKLSTSLDLTYNTDNKTFDQKNKSSNIDFTLNPAYPLSKLDRLSLVVSANKDLKDQRNLTYADSYLGHSRDFYKNTDLGLKINGLTRIYHPTSEESQKNKTLKTKLYFAPQIAIDLSKKASIPVNITYRPYYQQSFHKYKVAYDGTSNIQTSISHRLILDLSIGEMFAITLDNIYGRSFTYYGNSKDSFNLDQSLQYSLNEKLNFAIGHNNSGNALKANGKDSNVELFNKNNSTFYFNTSIRI